VGGRQATAARRDGDRPGRPSAEARDRAGRILERLRAAIPDARCALDHRNAYELLVATILSAQCTDERVNQVTPAFFAEWPTPAALARADPREVEQAIRPTGFFRNKARSLLGAAAHLVERHGGEVPSAMADLLELPGVARKTANVVRGVAFGLADGVVVDTHVRRIAGRLGLTHHADPVRIERDLMGLLPPASWIDASHLLIHHGRRTCRARRPLCGSCPVAILCPSAASLGGASAGRRR